MKPFVVYMLRCADGSFYLGHTDDLERRIAEHEVGELPGHSRLRLPVELVWSQETASREEALAAERQMKGWSRAKKKALIAGDWDRISELARGRGSNKARARLRQAQTEQTGGRSSEESASRESPPTPPVRPEPVEGSGAAGAGLRQAQTEQTGGRSSEKSASRESPPRFPVRPEPVEGSGAAGAGLRQAETERTGGRSSEESASRESSPRLPVRPEPVEGSGAAGAGLRQAQTERTGGRSSEESASRESSPTPPVRPEPVEGSGAAGAASDPLLLAVLRNDRRALAKAITLLESTRPDHRRRADALLNALLPSTGHALRVGISGVPGVGKSTFIEALGLSLIARGHRLAVLAIDPSSSVSGGSILGDKTRMERLSVDPRAYIRPSPASGTLGGVAGKTREAMLVCEAAGHDVVIVETVGVGQSETAVASMTDCFVLLQLPNAGDDLQAIKKGVMELADLVVINKADLDPAAATRAKAQIEGALRILGSHGRMPAAEPQVLLASALNADGIASFWTRLEALIDARRASGDHDHRRRQQALAWMWEIIEARLRARFREHPGVREALPATLGDLAASRVAPSAAARRLLELLDT